ncbi:hypothetical protein DBV15_02643 [Temnothorax longispinosus]|uniref:Uncharacterized protein n=1 Tax=Temnothorax longispinosus TaxID=300112 RepID=A0A4V3S9N4_9HYME|nr:hypothetical protein DBV15_02643 [Temnothorax longispinosus]
MQRNNRHTANGCNPMISRGLLLRTVNGTRKWPEHKYRDRLQVVDKRSRATQKFRILNRAITRAVAELDDSGGVCRGYTQLSPRVEQRDQAKGQRRATLSLLSPEKGLEALQGVSAREGSIPRCALTINAMLLAIIRSGSEWVRRVAKLTNFIGTQICTHRQQVMCKSDRRETLLYGRAAARPKNPHGSVISRGLFQVFGHATRFDSMRID